VIFVIGVAAGADKERVKNQQLLLEQQVKYEENQKDIIKRKDATISLLLREYDSFRSSSLDLRDTVSRLQHNLNESNRKLRDSEGACSKRLAQCQELLSRGTDLLDRCAQLYATTAIKKDAVVNMTTTSP
jgi:hypothetical protein